MCLMCSTNRLEESRYHTKTVIYNHARIDHSTRFLFFTLRNISSYSAFVFFAFWPCQSLALFAHVARVCRLLVAELRRPAHLPDFLALCHAVPPTSLAPSIDIQVCALSLANKQGGLL